MLSTSEIALRLLLAAALGGVIGFERERRHTWAAGLRTHMLVCLGSALVMIVSAYAFFDVLRQSPQIELDPSRIAAQVVSGIGFLGAGTIMFLQRDNVIRGLTTAAGLWTVAAIGLAVGGGMYAAAVIGTVIAWVILAILRPLEGFLNARKLQAPELRVSLASDASLLPVAELLAARNLPLATTTTRHMPDDGDEMTIRFGAGCERDELLELADTVRHLAGVNAVTTAFVPPEHGGGGGS